MGKLVVIMLLVVLLTGLVSVSPSVDVSAQEPLTSTRITKDWGYEYTALTGDKIKVGDKSTTEFKPTLKLERWGGEAYIEVSLPTTEKISPTTTTEKVVWEGQTVDAHFYPLEPTEQYELGGFEFEVILKEKPLTNKIILDFNTQGLKFFYQRPLTRKFQDGWNDRFQDFITVTETEVRSSGGKRIVYRPENVVGGYAVYHTSKGGLVDSRGKDYKTGQAFFIYRPKIIDARGDWAWSEQYIDPKAGKQIITIPQWFLDTATYPIRHAAGDTFGYTTVGGTEQSFSTNALYCNEGGYAGAAGTGVSISKYIPTGTYGDPTELALYKVSDDTFVKATDTINSPNRDAWNVSNFTDAPTLEAINYLIVFWGEGDATAYNDTDVNMMFDVTAYPGSWPDPAGWTVSIDQTFSIYCTYTPAVGIVAPTVVTNNATSVEETTATLSGNITATGGENCTDRGFQWDIDTGAPYADNWTEAGDFDVGNFTHGVTGLPTGTTIYYRASANNSAGWGYGSEVTFTTKSAAAPSPAFPSEILPEGRPAPIGIGHLAWFIPLVLFSVPAFWRRNALLFMLAAACSLMMGFYWYVIFTTNLGMSIGILLVAYSLVCLIFALGCLFKRRHISEG